MQRVGGTSPCADGPSCQPSQPQPRKRRHIVEATDGIGNHGGTRHTVGIKAHFLEGTGRHLGPVTSSPHGPLTRETLAHAW